MKNSVGIVCGFLHEEAVGRLVERIVSGTRCADASANRVGPYCDVAKTDCEVVEI